MNCTEYQTNLNTDYQDFCVTTPSQTLIFTPVSTATSISNLTSTPAPAVLIFEWCKTFEYLKSEAGRALQFEIRVQQGMVDGSASKPTLRQDTGFMVEKPYHDIAP